MHKNAIERIILVTKRIEHFWRYSHGWAPGNAAALLASARLDRQTSFTTTLYDYLEPFPPEQAEARQILGYASLRSLSEGLLKLFLAVWLNSYLADPDVVLDRKGKIVPPEDVQFDRLIAFYAKRMDDGFEPFLRRIQQRGNAIHHFTDRDIGTQEELIDDIVNFKGFLLSVNDRLPYPDDDFNPGHP